MSDSLYAGRRLRTFNVIDDFNRKLLHVEIDTSITGKRLIRVFEFIRMERGLPETLRTDNGPEFLGDLTPAEYLSKNAGNSTFQLST